MTGVVVLLALLALGLLLLAVPLVLARLRTRPVPERMAVSILALTVAAQRAGRGETVAWASTGIVELDGVAQALAEAARQQRAARLMLEHELELALKRTRDAEQRLSHNRRMQAVGPQPDAVAHDFNNLLGVVSNSAHLIERQIGDSPAQVQVAAILRAVEAGSRLTQQLMRAAEPPASPR